MALPPEFELVKQGEQIAELRDRTNATGWWLFYFPELRLVLDPQHAALHRRDTLHHTRALFDTMFEGLRAQSGSGPRDKPRTADRSWTPLIELDTADVPGGRAATILHRMSYQPGHETIMGHTLIPLAGGMFEARWVCPTLAETGLRESLLAVALGLGPDRPHPGQAVFDAPEHDDKLPQHPLTRARRARAWHRDRLEVLAPPPPAPARVALDAVGGEVALPPRFQLRGTAELDEMPAYLFDRVTFSGTDGIDRLVVARAPKPFRAHSKRRALALAAARHAKLFLGPDVADAEPRVVDELSTDDVVTVVAEGQPRDGGVPADRVVGTWFVRDGRLAVVAVVGSVAPPLAEVVADLDVVVRGA